MGIFRVLILSTLALALGGCALMRSDYTEPTDFDLGNPTSEAVTTVALPIRFGVFRNISGANRKFLIRESSNRLVADDYNCWILSPELLLRRRIRAELQDPTESSSKGVLLTATLYRFEFDRERHIAVLSVEFSAKLGSYVESTSLQTFESAYQEDVSESAASAMSENASKATQVIRKLIDSVATRAGSKDEPRKSVVKK